MNLPALSADQMREVDRLMVEQYGIQLLQMMENAGCNLALLARRILSADDEEDALQDRPIVVLAGRGNNGGGGLAAARHLLNWGAWVQIVLTHPPNDLPPGRNERSTFNSAQDGRAPRLGGRGLGTSAGRLGHRRADRLRAFGRPPRPDRRPDPAGKQQRGANPESGRAQRPRYNQRPTVRSLCRSDRHHDFGPSQTRSVAATRTRGPAVNFSSPTLGCRQLCTNAWAWMCRLYLPETQFCRSRLGMALLSSKSRLACLNFRHSSSW